MKLKKLINSFFMLVGALVVCSIMSGHVKAASVRNINSSHQYVSSIINETNVESEKIVDENNENAVNPFVKLWGESPDPLWKIIKRNIRKSHHIKW